jgi:hypothetical protein
MWISKVLYVADLSIDTRRELGLGPKRLPSWRSAHIGWLLQSHDGLFYDRATQSLHNFVVPGAHIIRRPVDISLVDDGLTIFNLRQDEYALEMYGPMGDYTFTPGVRATWATELRVVHLEPTSANEVR